MDKVTVSRAVKRLTDHELVKAAENIGDGRSKLLNLSPKGAKLYRHLVPKVLDVESKLLEGISDAQQFLLTMTKIRNNKIKHSL